MPRVNLVKHAARDYPEHGIQKGESYYWWKFRYGGKHMSKTFPKQSQLTQSSYLSSIYELREREFDGGFDDAESFLDEIKGDLEQIRDDCQGNLDNMPEGLQQGSTGELLQERIDKCDEVINELESVSIDEPDEGEEWDRDAFVDEIESILSELS